MLLARYDWPGNIRELENTIERAVILCLGEQITPKELPPQILPEDFSVGDKMVPGPNGLSLKEMEREAIRATLAQTHGNKSQTSRILGIARQTLLNKIKEYDL